MHKFTVESFYSSVTAAVAVGSKANYPLVGPGPTGEMPSVGGLP